MFIYVIRNNTDYFYDCLFIVYAEICTIIGAWTYLSISVQYSVLIYMYLTYGHGLYYYICNALLAVTIMGMQL